MIKFGVRRLDQYRAEPPSGFFERLAHRSNDGRISCRLLRVPLPPSPAEVEIFEHIMRGLRLNSGIYRTTFRKRFEHLDPKTNQVLRARFDASSALSVEDWAASDCLTASEWAGPLFAAFPNARLGASDLTLFLLDVSMPAGDAFIVESDGAPLQYLSGPFVIQMSPREPRSLPLNWLLYLRAAAKLARERPRWNIPESWLWSDSAELASGDVRFRKISVVHPEAEQLARVDRRFSIRRHSAFDSLTEPVDVIRSMNIFNLAYFSEPRLKEGVAAVWRSLKPGGVWIVGRTFQQSPPTHDVTYFARTPNGFDRIERVGEGSEIEHLGLAFRM